MTPQRSILFFLVLTVLACASRTTPTTDGRAPAPSGIASLSVTVLGLESEDGEVALALFGSAEAFEARADPVAAGRVPPANGVAVWQVENLRPGTYALAVYQDLNGNGTLDRTTLGPPAEPYGFSNDARGVFGPPKFDKAAIEIGPGNLSVEITLR